MAKLIVVIGVTGNQGGSVAQRFLKDPNYRVRGVTRNPDSPAAQKLAAQGIEIVKGELDDPESLISAFKGANLIFSVTNYWEPFFRPDCRQKAEELGITCRKYAYDVEYRQGKNIADAAATTVDTLDENGFIASTLSHATKCSKGKITEAYHFDSKADIFPYYVEEKHPKLAAKMSCVQTGYFNTSYKLAPNAFLRKLDDGSFLCSFPQDPHKPVPHLAVNEDTGNFVYAVAQLPPGKHYMAEGTTCSWTDYTKAFSAATGRPARYEQCSMDDIIQAAPDPHFGREVGDMLLYSSDPGYDGGDTSLLHAADIQKLGVDCPMTSLLDWMKNHDYSALFAGTLGRDARQLE